MKKLFASLLLLTLAVTLSAPSFAQDAPKQETPAATKAKAKGKGKAKAEEKAAPKGKAKGKTKTDKEKTETPKA